MNDLGRGYIGVDRRRFPRVNAMVEYKIIENIPLEYGGNTKNVSEGGIAFFAQNRIKENSVLSLFVSLPDTTDFQAKAQLVWCDSAKVSWDSGIRYECGVKFIEIDQSSRQKISKYTFLRLSSN